MKTFGYLKFNGNNIVIKQRPAFMNIIQFMEDFIEYFSLPENGFTRVQKYLYVRRCANPLKSLEAESQNQTTRGDQIGSGPLDSLFTAIVLKVLRSSIYKEGRKV